SGNLSTSPRQLLYPYAPQTPSPPLFTGSSEPSFHWGDDILFDESKGSIDPDAGFTTTTKILLHNIIQEVLIEKCHYPPRNILFYGYGQGGMAALSVAAAAATQDTEMETEMEFGGVVSVGGRLPSSSISTSGQSKSKEQSKGKCKTPVLVCGGSRSREVTRTAVDALKERFAAVEYVRWAKEGDGMPGSREEMLPIMKFFARRLRSRAGVPEGAVEV
ncbi:hypothetical protein LAWI1_G008880, partial [Lachnellula willkommii]